MRKTLVLFGSLALTGWVVVRFCSHDVMPKIAQAQERIADASVAARATANNAFEVPEVDDAEELVEFVKSIKQMQPSGNNGREEYDAQAPTAIRTACERILKIDRSLRSDVRRFAERELTALNAYQIDKDCPYPVFSAREVLDVLTVTGGNLVKAGKTKSDPELRRQLDRETTEMELPAPSKEALSDQELYRRACDSVFVVCSLYRVAAGDDNQWETSLATAFAVTKNGILSTSCHVFDNEDNADAVIVMDRRKNVYPIVELLAANRHLDTCLFRIKSAEELKPLPLAANASPGTRVRVLGHPGDSFYFFSAGTLANYEKDREGNVWMNVTADFGQGSSGGPVMDEFGNVVGQVSRTFTLYAGGATTRRRFHRSQGDKAPAEHEGKGQNHAEEDFADPQMVFKSCVPARAMQALVRKSLKKSDE